jgi:TRAP-type C4-dicarboxylate transport system permease small subunit
VKSNTSTKNEGKAQKWFSSFEDFFSFYAPGVLTVILMIVMVTEICLRWIFRTSMMGVVEIVESAMVVIVFCSLSGIQREKGHVRMNLLTDKLSGKKSGALLETLSIIYMFVICAPLLHPFTVAVIRFKQANEMTEYLSIPIWIVGIFMPLGLLVICIRLIAQGVGEGRKLFKVSDDPCV